MKLSAMKGLSTIKVLEMDEASYHVRQLEDAKKLTGFTKKDIIIALPVNAKPENISDTILKENIVIINGNREDEFYYKKPGTKDHYEKLVQLSSQYKHSNSEEFAEIHSLLERNKIELKYRWPITPQKNLIAEQTFLTSVLMLADNFPHQTCTQCLLEIEAKFANENRLADVIMSSPNAPVVNWGIFRFVLSFNTPTGELLQRVKLAEKNKEVKPAEQQTGQEQPDSTRAATYQNS
jgi:hypothetical protein